MRRREFLTGLGATASTWPLRARAQPLPGKVARLGYLGVSNAAASVQVIDATVKGFRELGYVQGAHYLMEYRWAEGRYEMLPALAAELVALKLDVIVAPTGNAAVAVKNATTTIPIVIASVSDPVGLGLANSLAQPGNNVTGLCLTAGLEVHGKRLELLAETVKSRAKIGVLSNPDFVETFRYLEMTKLAAEQLGIQLLTLEARAPDEFDGVFRTMIDKRIDGVFVLGDTMFWMHRKAIAEQASKHRLPSISGYREYVEAGGLMSYGASIPDNYRRSAAFVDKILRGANPGDLPIEQPTKFEFLVNLQTAKALGLTIPHTIVARADEVIE